MTVVTDATDAMVAVVDDDYSIGRSFARVLRMGGHEVETFVCARDFLDRQSEKTVGCLVLDVQLPDLNGLDLQSELRRSDCQPPVVFVTGHGDIPMTVRAMRAGAVDFLTKPCSASVLLDAVGRAKQVFLASCSEAAEMNADRERLTALTPRERQVLSGIVTGLRNKQIAADLNICEKTVKVHRARVMTKTGARSVAELVRLCENAGLAADDFPAGSVFQG